MNTLEVVLILHIVFGVLWAATMVFFVIFLEAPIRDIDAAVARALGTQLGRGYDLAMPVTAGITILSGVALYVEALVVLSGVWVRSWFGVTVALGGLTSLVALALGMGVVRPAARRVVALAESLVAEADPTAQQAGLAELNRARARAQMAAIWTTGLLILVIVSMAVARFV